MKYYLVAGEASGDLHASHLMQALREEDAEARFRGIGGDMMRAQGATLVHHYQSLAYMGIIPVLRHLPTILRALKNCRRDIQDWHPDVLILVDYPGFNLKIAKAIHNHTNIPIFYYIPPKIWAWKERRIKNIRRYVDRVFSILPFEVDFYEGKHRLNIDYVGNPTVDEVETYKQAHTADFAAFCSENGLPDKPLIALLPGSRQQEVRDNLRRMVEAARPFSEKYQLVVAGSPGLDEDFYYQCSRGLHVNVLYGSTYRILQHAQAALVTSGTATLETALFRVPQVVCYYMKAGWLANLGQKLLLKIPFVSLVNLVVGRGVVPELVAASMSVGNVRRELQRILSGGSNRSAMLQGYDEVVQRLGAPGAPRNAARLMVQRLLAIKA